MRRSTMAVRAPVRTAAVALLAAALLSGCGVLRADAPAETRSAPAAAARAAPGDWGAYDRYEDAALEAYVLGVAEKIAAHAELGDAPLRIVIVDAPAPNAAAGSDGEIAITLGLIALLADEAELAWVLSHEIAHLERGHPELLAELTRAPDRDGYARRSALRRRFETEADARGVELMTAAGYDVSAARRVTRVLGASRRADSDLASHPGAEERLDALPAESAAGGVRNADAFLDAIEGLGFAFPGRLTALLREGVLVAPSLDLVLVPPLGYELIDKGDAIEFASADGEIRLRLKPAPPSAEGLEASLRDGLHRSIASTSGAGPLFDVRPYRTFGGLSAIAGRAATSFGGVESEARLAVIEDSRRRYALAAYYPTARRDEAERAARALESGIGPVGPDDAVLLDRYVVATALVGPGEDFEALRRRIDGPGVREAFFFFFNGLDPEAPIPAGRRVKVVVYR